MIDPVLKDLARHEELQVESENAAEYRDLIESEIERALIGKIATMILNDDMISLAKITEKYGQYLYHITACESELPYNHPAYLISFDTLTMREKDIGKIEKTAERIVKLYLDISDDVDKYIEQQQKITAESKLKI